MPGDFLDLSSDPTPNGVDGAGQGGRAFVGVHFTCCDIYTRVYINAERTAYRGFCPRCARPVSLRIGPGGTDSRFFTVS